MMAYTPRDELERHLVQPLATGDRHTCVVCGIAVDPARIRCLACPAPTLPASYLAARDRLRDRIGANDER